MYAVVECRRPDESVELKVKQVLGATPEQIQKGLEGNETFIERFSSPRQAETFLRSQSLHAVVEIRKGDARWHVVREASADASREPQKGKKGTERIVAMFRERKPARLHAKKLDREAAEKPTDPEESEPSEGPEDGSETGLR